MGKGKEMITLRELKEKAVSKQQQKLMGLALAYKRGDVPEDEVSDTVRDLAKSMSEKELEDFAKTKHKGLPDKVDEKYTDKQDASYRDRRTPKGAQKRLKALNKKALAYRKKHGKFSSDPYSVAKKYKMDLKFESVKEDGHTDVDSSERMCKTVMEDAKEIMEYLSGMDGESSLPTWWTNKLATASKDMNSLRDYLVNPDDEKEVKEYLEAGTDDIRKSYAKMTPGQTNELSTGADRAAAATVAGLAGYGVKKAIDRFRPTQVAKARREREAKRKERNDAVDYLRKQREKRMKQQSKSQERK